MAQVSGATAQADWNEGATPASLASTLASAINVAAGGFVGASPSGSTVIVTSLNDGPTADMLCFAKMLSERDKGQILKFGSSFGDDFQLEKRCSIVTNEESKDLQTLFSRKLWSTAMKDVRSSGSGSQIITMMQTA